MNLAIVDATADEPDRTTGRSRYAVSLANRPLIHHVLTELAHSGVERVRVIVAPSIQHELREALATGGPLGIDVALEPALAPQRQLAVLMALNDALQDEPVFLHPANCLFRGQVSDMRQRFHAGDVDAVLPAQASEWPAHPAKPRPMSEAVLVLGQSVRPLVGELVAAGGAASELLDSLLTSTSRLAFCAETTSWCYSDATDALLAANRMLLDALPPATTEASYGEGTRVQGRVQISPTAYIANSTIHGPVAIDDRAIIEDSFIGPFSAVGADAVLRGAEIDNSMVLPRAEIHHIGHRLEASIIGERARLTRSFAFPSGLHVRLGPNSVVSFG